MHLASVIIPVYNTGESLRTCVYSVLAQTHKVLEIIIIDDGSNTETAGICDELSTKDARIRVIHQANAGVSAARNIGLDTAKGDVFFFLDSDDAYYPGMVEEMLRVLDEEDADIAVCDCMEISDRQNIVETLPIFPHSVTLHKKDINPEALTHLAGSACRCAYRSTTARFKEGLKFSEDRLFNLHAMAEAKRIAYHKKPLYQRNIRNNSACLRYYPDMTEQVEIVAENICTVAYEKWGPEYANAYEAQIQRKIWDAVVNYTSAACPAPRKELRRLCDSDIIRKHLSFNSLKGKFLLQRSIAGLYILGRLNNFYHRICRKGQYRR